MNFQTVIKFIVVLLFTWCFSSCKVRHTASHAEEPRIVFFKDTVNLDTINLDSTIDISFKFHNEGIDTLKIFKVESSCNCTVVKSYSENTALNQKGEISIKFSSKSAAKGEFIRRLAVLSNSRLQIKVLIIKGIKI